jgi:murein DD-endopeptidase MepM/ murein hydrolase activator NlpD
MNKKIFFTLFFLFSFNNFLLAVEFQGDFTEGSLIRGKADVGTKILVDQKLIKVSNNGFFVFGVEKGKKNIVIEVQDKYEKKIINKKIKKRKFSVQKIDGLPSKMVTPGKEEIERIKKEQIFFDKMRLVNSDNEFFYSKFIKPADGIVSGSFGSQRILNGKPKNPHLGMDIANKKGTAVRAAASGVVTLSHKDLYYTGGTIAIEHGHGITSVYYHLNSVDVLHGQKISQGEIIGTIGSTGRATGDHLHFGIYWARVALDPELVLKN